MATTKKRLTSTLSSNWLQWHAPPPILISGPIPIIIISIDVVIILIDILLVITRRIRKKNKKNPEEENIQHENTCH